MQDAAKSARVFRFGVFEMDAATGELRKQGLRIRLQEQPSQILLMLLDRAGELVSREEICHKLWPADTFVDFDQSLGTALRKLRHALGDDAETPRYIETIPKRGFRFVSPVERISPGTDDSFAVSASDAPPPERKLESYRTPIVRSIWLAVLVVTAIVLSFVLGWFLRSGRDASDPRRQLPQPIRSSLLPPPSWSFEHSSFSISPDGTRLAFVAVGSDGTDKLWIRTFSSSNAQQINGTDGGLLPFWSPDSRKVGFFAAGKLNVVDLENGAVRILCEAPFGRGGGAWSSNGVIVFSPSVAGPLYRIQDAGGVPIPVTRMAKPGRHMWPFFLPDGTHFFYSESNGPADPEGNNIYIGSLDGSAPKLILSKTSANVAYASGYLLYSRDHTLWAQPFDLSRLQLTGTAASITSQELDEELSFSHGEFSVSQNGTAIFESLSDSRTVLRWLDRNGKQLDDLSEPGYREPRLSPDGRFLAVSSDDERNGKFFVRVYDLRRGISTRLTDSGNDRSPAWSLDGKSVTYTTLDEIKQVQAEGSAPARVLRKGGVYLGHMDWSQDGHMVFTDFSGGAPALKVYSAADHRVMPFAIGAEGRFSPNGKWIAYVGPLTAPDTDAIFIAPFPGPEGQIRVSTGSGAQPVWARDGRHLFYIAADRKLIAVDFNPQTGAVAAPRPLFQTSIIAPNFADTQYAVSRDGRFLINSLQSKASSPLTLILGWTTQLQESGASQLIRGHR
jgi:eukaryotic-like serine/threonine-protein kinase